MSHTLNVLGAMGVGAGFMSLLAPQQGRRRQAKIGDQGTKAVRKTRQAVDAVRQDINNRLQGLRSGDLSVLVGGRRALQHPFTGGWSPSGRALLGMLGGGLFLYGLTKQAPTACVIGTIGLALVAEGITNANIQEIQGATRGAAEMTSRALHTTAEAAHDLALQISREGHNGKRGTEYARA